MQVHDNMSYRGISNQPSATNYSLYLSDFFSFNALDNDIFRQRFLCNCASWSSHIDMQVDDNMLYRTIANQPSASYSTLYLSDFLSFNTSNNEIFRQRLL